MASFQRVAIIGDCWQVHRQDHRIPIEQPGVTSGPPINASGQPAIRRGHSAIASTAFVITAMSPSAPGTSKSGSVARQCSQVHLRHRRCEHRRVCLRNSWEQGGIHRVCQLALLYNPVTHSFTNVVRAFSPTSKQSP
jgi:hypothetical protein